MARASDPFEDVQQEADPIRQAKLAGQLITVYQQRSVELARLRRQAINRAAEERGISYSAIASELGLTRGRVAQIRRSAPPPERAFFGIGPVTIAVPLREVPGRSLPVISSEDARAYDMLAARLAELGFQFSRYGIPASGHWTPPAGDVVAICGPKSSPVTAKAIESDPFLSFSELEPGLWVISDRVTGEVYESPIDVSDHKEADVAYLGRVATADRELLVIAGVHAIGSVGAVDYLIRSLSSLYAEVGTSRFSVVVASEHEGETVRRSEALCPARVHTLSG